MEFLGRIEELTFEILILLKIKRFLKKTLIQFKTIVLIKSNCFNLNKFHSMKNVKKSLLSLTLCLLTVGLSLSLLESCDSPQKAVVMKSANVPQDYSRPLSFQDAKDSFRIAFYNVENLFDTIDEPNKILYLFLIFSPSQLLVGGQGSIKTAFLLKPPLPPK